LKKLRRIKTIFILHLSTGFTNELKIDQSLAHNGVCLTVVAIDFPFYTVTAIAETLSKTNLGSWERGTVVNLERCMQLNGRLDGHIVQGHVDTMQFVNQLKIKMEVGNLHLSM
jgi:riboflavin synthase